MTVPENRDLVTKTKKIEILMLVTRFNPPLRCVKTLKKEQNFVCTEGQPARLTHYSNREIEVKKRENID